MIARRATRWEPRRSGGDPAPARPKGRPAGVWVLEHDGLTFTAPATTHATAEAAAAASVREYNAAQRLRDRAVGRDYDDDRKTKVSVFSPRGDWCEIVVADKYKKPRRARKGAQKNG